MLLVSTRSDPEGKGACSVGGRAIRPRVDLHGGQIFVSAEPTIVASILGSCVAVCLTDHGTRIGGINHFLLPHSVQHAISARYGAVAIPLLINQLLEAGARRESLEAKVFGGACVVPQPAGTAEHLGAQNVRLAFELLRRQGIPVVAQDVEGDRGRRILYHTDSGVAWMRRL